MDTSVDVRPLRRSDRSWATALMGREWGSDEVAVHGELYRPLDLPCLVAERDGEPIGLAAYRVADEGCEIVALASAEPNHGAGSTLVAAVRAEAERLGCRRLWAVTTNDNLAALRFYQRRGFRLAALHPGAVAAARRLKPTIPRAGSHGLPILDEIVLEVPLSAAAGGSPSPPPAAGVTYRQVTPADARLLATMNQRLIWDEGHRNPMGLAQLEHRMAHWLRGEFEGHLFSVDGVPAGYCLWRREAEHVYIRHFYVEPAYRRRGVGRSAIEWLLRNAWRGSLRLRVDVLVGNAAGISFWKATGFEPYALTMEREAGRAL